jgi:predicted secreted protein
MRAAFVVASLCAAPLPALSADTSPPTGVVALSASASIEVPKDWMAVTFTTTRDGPQAAAVQAGLKQALDAALAEARRVAKPGQLEVQTGNFSLYPRINSKGTPAGWQGTAELLVEGRDMQSIGQLAGRIASMTINRVAYALSREAREKVEAEVAAQAVARYRSKAADATKNFGYAGYTIREVTLNTNEPPSDGPMPMMRAQAMVAQDAPLPVEAGKAQVSVTASGSVQLTR